MSLSTITFLCCIIALLHALRNTIIDEVITLLFVIHCSRALYKNVVEIINCLDSHSLVISTESRAKCSRQLKQRSQISTFAENCFGSTQAFRRPNTPDKRFHWIYLSLMPLRKHIFYAFTTFVIKKNHFPLSTYFVNLIILK